jgi:hypothetical protein
MSLSTLVQFSSVNGVERGGVPDPDGAEGTCQDDPAHAGVAGGAQHPQDALACWDHQLVVVRRRMAQGRRGHVEDEVAVGDGSVPAVGVFEVGAYDLETVAVERCGRVEPGAQRRLAPQVTDCGAYGVPGVEQCRHAPAPDESCSSGDQYLCHPSLLSSRLVR